jgi:aspartate beta-hydroxylase
MIQEIANLEAQAARALQANNRNEAMRAWQRILTLDANHLKTLNHLGGFCLRQGDFGGALAAFTRVAALDNSNPQAHVNVALVHKATKNEAGEEAAIKAALTADAMDLLALLMRATLLERRGDRHQASSAFAAVATVAPPMAQLHPDLHGAVQYAIRYKTDYDRDFGLFMDQYLKPHFDAHQGENLQRFGTAIDIMVGRARRYDSRSELFHYPNLAAIEFFEREQFMWLDAVEAATDTIREEFLALPALREGQSGLVPYITYDADKPLNQWRRLNHSLDWSAFHLLKDGALLAENTQYCPHTMAALNDVPSPKQVARTPNAMFSLLKPQTRIPPHVGVSNVRLVTHLPLIIPENCGFRVGNTTREWIPGKAWVFDDTIEHEAWNLSDKLRVVLIFDIWHPHLTLAEREMITAMNAGLNAFVGEVGGFAL